MRNKLGGGSQSLPSCYCASKYTEYVLMPFQCMQIGHEIGGYSTFVPLWYTLHLECCLLSFQGQQSGGRKVLIFVVDENNGFRIVTQ